MKKLINLVVCTLMLSFWAMPSLVLAETSNLSDTSNSTSESQATFDQRQEDRKQALKIALTAVEKVRIKDRCKAAQGKVSSVVQRANGISTSRSEVFGNVTTKLNTLVDKLKARSADTSELEADIAVLNTKITKFNTDFATYKQAINDLAAVNCQNDPAAFKAALLAGRNALDQVKKDSNDVKAYLKDTIRPLLTTIRSQLGPAPTNGGSQ
jgi:ABC-type transporter Mla subunit MlaD